jgi:energy-coupling factor transporter ATP-binding protein EcfA2
MTTKLDRLDLSACTTNEEVCNAVSSRIDLIPYKELLAEVEKKFVYQNAAVNAIYTGLSTNINVFLSGPGGYGKSTLVQYILDIYNIPYTVIVGYKDMPVDALLGIPDMEKLLKESKYEVNFRESSFCKPGVLIVEEFTDVLPATAAALKTILTEKGFHTKEGKVESLISCMIIAANKSSKEIITDESTRAFYKERFPLEVDIRWQSYTAKDYFKMLALHFATADTSLLYFMAKMLEDNHANYNNTISPRIAIEITKVYLSKGINFITHFPINTANINELKILADREYNAKSASKLLKEISLLIYSAKNAKDHAIAAHHALKKLNDLVVTEDLIPILMDAKRTIEEQLVAKPYTDSTMVGIDNIIKLLKDDKVSPQS